MQSSGTNGVFNLSPGSASTRRSGQRVDPFMAYNFRVEIGGMIVGGFTEASGLESSVETHEHREGGVNHYIHRLPGPATQTNLSLTKGIGGIDGLWDWYYDVTQGVIRRKHGTIMLMNAGQVPVMWWNFAKAYPVSWSGPQLEASGDAVAFQSVELVHQGLTKPLLSSALALGSQLG